MLERTLSEDYILMPNMEKAVKDIQEEQK